MSPHPVQLSLPLPPLPSADAADLVPDASNAAALAWLERPGDWPQRRLALHGPEGVGKSHMLHATAKRHGWRLLQGPGLVMEAALAEAAGTALDRADAAPEVALFHLINQAAASGAPLLLAARAPPARWATALPDLASRLRATQAVAIARPEAPLLAALLAKHIADRQLRVEPGVQAFLLARLPREAAAIAAAVAALDAASLAGGGAITRPFARQVLALQVREDPGADDPSATAPQTASPTRPAPG
ncbi:HdaA/DnaA family protein [Falsiroseomonas selenitidurans]|uniref:Chromosomal replication initiator DnaA n=1 Tax=Falsiroseomonas selenitidurans TaxID=2716335 RepID=A0ABX1E3Q9_9PROT|nr:DnaA/Hda family protein [Falsiroseomonas selenitidurans]NKC31809.1 chromosomal replication initiator DnaA [Falsiroseomonas selenitidurans]